ncbi:hypothetical protein LNKW23_40180 [Paralimibaculum aggregatum]|uniref:Formyl transferase N-terminal domain-containing protein n=1 Tax=Paralimibaculum aggregatum TaxID=3036245 RepID=A0ABQ6LR66_9RHOB|nr:formyltransferase family protein [Limibaculum sp. NKW23]GMG84802.1 hypothetical protein LNKW23_40180 [Limibaculum sp. NKW23]
MMTDADADAGPAGFGEGVPIGRAGDPAVMPAELRRRLAAVDPGARVVALAGARWGGLVLPGRPLAPHRPRPAGDALRVLAMTSWEFAPVLLRALLDRDGRAAVPVQLVGLATDDAVNPAARIGAAKRIWRHFDPPSRLRTQLATMAIALRAGVPAYTGELKCRGFRRLLDRWAPDLILCCCLGQRLDGPILSRPRLGAVNLHPSDLANGHGAGFDPHGDVLARGADSNVWTAHRMTETIDDGPVLRVSAPIPVRGAGGQVPRAKSAFYRMMHPALPGLADAVLADLAPARMPA